MKGENGETSILSFVVKQFHITTSTFHLPKHIKIMSNYQGWRRNLRYIVDQVRPLIFVLVTTGKERLYSSQN